jgi:hypothetical protein
VHRVSDLRAENWKPEWLIKRLWPWPGHGMLGGMEKTFKTWQLAVMAVAVASGRPCFADDRFEVVKRGPVVFFTGEAGQFSLERRPRRIATQLYGMTDEEYDQLPIWVVDQRAVMSSDRFLATLRAVIQEHMPVLVVIDPLYVYVGGGTDASNVFAVGEQLHAVSDICNEAQVSLVIGHHVRKTAAGNTPILTDLTQAGGREWVKAWWLVYHLQPPDPSAGRAWLQVQASGSEGYGGVYELDVCVGGFNWDTFDHDDNFYVEIRDGENVDPKAQREMARNLQLEGEINDLLAAIDEAEDFTEKTTDRKLAAALKWSRERVQKVSDVAVHHRLLEPREGPRNSQLKGLTNAGKTRLSRPSGATGATGE